MADNLNVTPGSGATIGFDEVTDGTLGSVKVGFGKIMDGTLDGTDKLKITSNNAAQVDATQLGGTNIAVNSGNKSNGTQRIVVATDQPSLTNPLVADTAPATQNITVVDSASTPTSQQNSQSAITGTPTANSAASFTIAGLSTIDVQVTGTWTGTIASEVSFDSGTTWFARGFHLAGTAYTIGSITSNATGNLSVAGVTNFRMRATAAMTGTAVVRISGSINMNTFYIANSPSISDPTTPSQKMAVDSSGAASTNQTKIGGTAVDTNSGNKSGGTQRVVIATDQPALTTPLPVNLSPQASGGWTPYLANAITTVVNVLSNAAGKFGGYSLINLNSAPAYLQVFDLATATTITLGTTVPTFVITLPANATAANGIAANLEISNGIAMALGIRVAATTTPTGSTTVSTGISGTILYK